MWSFFAQKGGLGSLLVDSVVNNNVVMSTDNDGNELILVGKGIGFQAKKKDLVDNKKIQKKFYLEDQDLFSKFKSILNEVSSDELIVTSEIINYAQEKLRKKLNESIYISLSDHIHYVIQRYKKNELITNTFVWDIKRFYNDEYCVAKHAVELINKKFQIELNEDEAGFIAFHFINTANNMTEAVDINKLTNLIHQIVSIVSFNLKFPIDTEDVNGYRFINHVKYFAQRILEKNINPKTDSSDDELYELVKNKYRQSFAIMLKIQDFLQKKYQQSMTKNDQLYFMIHIHRLITHSKSE